MCGGGHSISCAKAEEFPPKCYSQIVTETPRPWDRLPTETPKSYAAFLAYVALGARRSVREAAHQNYIKTTSPGGISSAEGSTIRKWLGWSAKHKWVSRANARDTWIAHVSDEQIVMNRAVKSRSICSRSRVRGPPPLGMPTFSRKAESESPNSNSRRGFSGTQVGGGGAVASSGRPGPRLTPSPYTRAGLG